MAMPAFELDSIVATPSGSNYTLTRTNRFNVISLPPGLDIPLLGEVRGIAVQLGTSRLAGDTLSVQLRIQVMTIMILLGRELPFYTTVAIMTFEGIHQLPVLDGTVSIEGSAVFGETLTAVTTELTSTPIISDLGTLSYRWRRDTTDISGATSSTYELVEADIGSEISVVVSAENCSGDVISENTDTVAKALQDAPDAPTLAVATSTSITLDSVAGCEYCKDGGAWQSSPVFAGLTSNTEYTFTQRYVETSTHSPSPESEEEKFRTTESASIAKTVANTISIYPNPAKNVLYFNIETSFEIVDLQGKTVLKSEKAVNSVNISDLRSGFYFVKTSTEKGISVQKIIKE
jgi:hypothetical protein